MIFRKWGGVTGRLELFRKFTRFGRVTLPLRRPEFGNLTDVHGYWVGARDTCVSRNINSFGNLGSLGNCFKCIAEDQIANLPGHAWSFGNSKHIFPSQKSFLQYA